MENEVESESVQTTDPGAGDVPPSEETKRVKDEGPSSCVDTSGSLNNTASEVPSSSIVTTESKAAKEKDRDKSKDLTTWPVSILFYYYLQIRFCLFVFAVNILLKPVGDAPILKNKLWAVPAERLVSQITEFVKKYLKLEKNQNLVSALGKIP